MNRMRHAACRRALVDGDLNPDVALHLDECERCRAFSRDLAQVSEYVGAMAPGSAPNGLADRVVAHVRAAGPASELEAGADVLDLRRARGGGWAGTQRKPLLASLSVAASLILLVGVLAAVVPRGGDAPPVAVPGSPEEIDPLLAAAERTLETGTARVRLSGTASATIEAPTALVAPEVEFPDAAVAFEPPPFVAPPEPDFSGAPPEQQDEMRRQYQAQVDEMQRQHDEFVAESRRQYEQLQQDAAEVFSQIEIPSRFSFEMSVSAEGAIRFPDRMRLDGEMTVAKAEPSLPVDLSGTFGVAVDGDVTYTRGPDSAWVAVPGAMGPLGPLMADPDGLARLIGAARGDVSDLGEEELDGFRVRHFRFSVDAGVFAPAGTDAEGSVDVWIGVDDSIVHKMVSTSSSDFGDPSGFSSSMEASMTLELYDFGADVTVEIPAESGTSSAPLGPSALLAPFDTGMAAGLFYTVSGGVNG